MRSDSDMIMDHIANTPMDHIANTPMDHIANTPMDHTANTRHINDFFMI